MRRRRGALAARERGKLALFAGIDDVRFKRDRAARATCSRSSARSRRCAARSGAAGASDRRRPARRPRHADVRGGAASDRPRRTARRSRSPASAATSPTACSRTTSSRSSSTPPTSGSSTAPAFASGGSPPRRGDVRPRAARLPPRARDGRRRPGEHRPADRRDRDARHGVSVDRGVLADRLGMPDAAAYDLSAGCTGFVYAIAQAYGMIAAGLAQRALVVGGDVLSSILDWHDRSTLVLFGDGAGAVVLERGRRRAASSASSSAPTAAAARTSGCPAAARGISRPGAGS